MATPSDVLEAALNELRKRREQLDRTIDGLESELGISSGSQTAPSPIAEPQTFRPRGTSEQTDLLKMVYEGQFYGKSQTQAAKELLNLIKRPLKTPILCEALTKSGMKVYAPSLYTTFKRSSDFVLVLPNTWGLKEWYPGGIKSFKSEKKSKRRERRKKIIKPMGDAESSSEQPKKRGRPRKDATG